MQQNSHEIKAAFLAVVVITLAYLFVISQIGVIPAAGGLFGHLIGVAGFLLMIATETLYSFRKRSRRAKWGKMSTWLQFHIFTGIVGPYMVLLHTSWKFNGLAGITMLLTLVIVASGFIGRYIYTAIPRSADGAVIEKEELEKQARQLEEVLQDTIIKEPGLVRYLPARLSGITTMSASIAASRQTLSGPLYRIQRWQEKQRLHPILRQQVNQLDELDARIMQLHRQVNNLVTARKTLSLWHSIHIPIGMALFGAASIHAAAALYYATLLH